MVKLPGRFWSWKWMVLGGLLLGCLGLGSKMGSRKIPDPVNGGPPVVHVPADPQGLDTALPRRFRVVVWNVLKGKRDGWSERFEELVSGRHLALFQEGWLENGSSGMKKDFERSAMAWQFVISWTKRGAHTGVTTGSLASPTCLVPLLSPDLEPVIRTPKTAIATCYAIEGSPQTLLVLNIHAVNAVGLKAQKRQLDPLESMIASHDGPVLLAGDFNTQTAAKVQQVRDLASRTAMTEVELDETAGRRSRVMGRPIDYAFVRGLTVHQAHVVHTEQSDHNPLLLDLAVL